MNRTWSVVCLLAVALPASTAAAQPSINLVNNGDNSATVQLVIPGVGAVGTEIASLGGEIMGSGNLTFTNAYIADPSTFIIANPGFNPFTNSITNGLYLDGLDDNEVFASYGTAILSEGTYDFLTIEFEGTGRIEAFGVVGFAAQVFDVAASLDIVPEPSAAMLSLLTVGLCATRRRRALAV